MSEKKTLYVSRETPLCQSRPLTEINIDSAMQPQGIHVICDRGSGVVGCTGREGHMVAVFILYNNTLKATDNDIII